MPGEKGGEAGKAGKEERCHLFKSQDSEDA